MKPDPCCCQWGCDCRLREGKCHVCSAKAERARQRAEADKQQNRTQG